MGGHHGGRRRDLRGGRRGGRGRAPRVRPLPRHGHDRLRHHRRGRADRVGLGDGRPGRDLQHPEALPSSSLLDRDPRGRARPLADRQSSRPELLTRLIDYRLILYGTLLLVSIYWLPEGVVGAVTRARRRLAPAHSALASSLEASVSTRTASALASSLEASVSTRTASLSPLG